MQEKNFNKNYFSIDEFIDSVIFKTKNSLPDDISEQARTFITETVDNFLHMTNNAIDNNYMDSIPKNIDKKFVLQFLAEQISRTTIKLDNSKIPFEHWSSILQEVAFAIFEILCKPSGKKQKADIQMAEQAVNKSYTEALQKLLEEKIITKQVFEETLKKSNIDISAAAEEQDDTEPESQLTLMQCMAASAVVIALVFVWYYRMPILAFLEPHKNLIIGIVILLAAVRAFIYFTTRQEIKKQLKEFDNTKQEMQNLVNPDRHYENLGTDILRLEVGAGVLAIADPDQEGLLLPAIVALRQELTDELGYIIPSVGVYYQ